MKRVFDIKWLVIAFFVGLLISGIGVGVGFFEFQGMTLGGEKVLFADEMTETEISIALPDEGSIYHYWENLKVEVDDTIDTNEAKIVISAIPHSNVNAYMQENYILNTDSGHIAKKKGYVLVCDIYNSSAANEMKVFKEMVYDIKNRKIYDYTTAPSSVIVRVNSANAERIKTVPQNYSLMDSLPFDMPEEEVYYDREYDEYYIITSEGKKVIYPENEEIHEEQDEEEAYNDTAYEVVIPADENTVTSEG